jgi:small-conductance mechanosensitive channel
LGDVLTSLDKMRTDAIEFLPKFLTAVILFIIGVAIAWFISRTIKLFMKKGGVDALCERVGVSRILGQAGIKAPLSDVVGKALFWVLILMFLMSAADSLGLDELSQPLRELVAFLPKVITAMIIAMVGLLVGDLARGVVAGGATRVGLDYAKALSNLVYAFILTVVLTIAVGTLGVDTTLIRHAVEIFLLAMAFAGALALGLGMRPLAQSIVSGVYARDLYPVGSKVQLEDNETRTVVSVGPVTTRLEGTDGSTAVVPNSDLVGKVIKAWPDKKSAE